MGRVHSALSGSIPTAPEADVSGQLNLVSLFAGIGGFELGLEQAGFNVVAQCEISPKCQHLLATHWPHVQRFGDICQMRAADVPHRVHAICGGFPCQDISFAGKGAGLAGERSGLWSEYARLIGEFRPDYVLVENVAALLGRGLGDVLGDLAALGYDAWWDCIPAAAVGAPHRRDRLWIVAYPRSVEHQGFGDAFRRALAQELSRSHLAYPAGEGWHGRGAPRSRREAGDFTARGGEPRNRGSVGSELANPMRDDVQGFVAGGADPEERSGSFKRSPGSRTSSPRGQWSVEPDVGRVAHGVPARVDRLHGLGNAVVPQIPEILGRAILSARAALQQRAAA